MKITNHTHYRSDQLRALISRVAQDELDPAHRKRLSITVKYHHGAGWVGGSAFLNSANMTLKIPHPRQYQYLGPLNVKEMASVIAHEMAHCRGMNHRDMKGNNRYYYTPGWQERYAYATEFPIDHREPAAKTKIGDEQKHVRALLMVKHWTTKTKKATTLLKKWTRKVRYYEQKMAAKKAEAL